MSRACPLLVFADDWGRHPSSAQHLIAQLRERHPVFWVNTIGTRTPTLDLATLRRGLEKLRHWTRPTVAPPDNPRVLNPWMWPWFSSSLARRLNRVLLLRQLRPVLEAMPQAPVAVTTLPIVADLIGHLPVARWVYYCVDDFAEWPGLDARALRSMEEELVRRADVVIAVSETLRQRLAILGREARLLTHGVDLDFWRSEDDDAFAEVERLPRPRALFWGVIDRRMDVAFVRRLAADLDGGTVLLVGPQQQPDPELLRLERVAVLPPVPFEQLPRLARAADVLIMPYTDAAVTRAMQPLKLKEYLATGKPVVVRDLPATREWRDGLDLAVDAEEFSRLVRRRIQLGVCPHQLQARARLQREDWAAKASAFVEWASEREEVVHA